MAPSASLALPVASPEVAGAPGRTLPIDASAPAFADVPATDGRRYGLDELAGEAATVLIFTANRCPTAKAHAGRIEAARRRFEGRGVRFVLINSNDPHLHPEERFDRLLERATPGDPAIPYLVDADQSIARAWGPTCTFHAFVLDADRRVRYEGRFDDARLEERVTTRDVEAALEAILAGRLVEVATTPAFGCALEIGDGGGPFALSVPPGPFTVTTASTRRPVPMVGGLAMASLGGWALAAFSGIAGAGGLMNHDALIHGGALGPPPLWLAVVAFLVAWQVMLAAMMVPASGPALAIVARRLGRRARPVVESVGFVAAFAAVWSAFGLAAFAGDWVLHHVVDASPWLAARPQLIGAGVLALAGTYQLTGSKRRSLAACRDPLAVAACCDLAGRHAGLRAGLRHALDCLGASWALMLLMFAVGPTDLPWMVALTGIMAYEVRADDGPEAARLFGVFLLGFAGAVGFGVMPLG
jgi:predicted metal-binding membrane protein/peroxiredoxin